MRFGSSHPYVISLEKQLKSITDFMESNNKALLQPNKASSFPGLFYNASTEPAGDWVSRQIIESELVLDALRGWFGENDPQVKQLKQQVKILKNYNQTFLEDALNPVSSHDYEPSFLLVPFDRFEDGALIVTELFRDVRAKPIADKRAIRLSGDEKNVQRASQILQSVQNQLQPGKNKWALIVVPEGADETEYANKITKDTSANSFVGFNQILVYGSEEEVDKTLKVSHELWNKSPGETKPLKTAKEE